MRQKDAIAAENQVLTKLAEKQSRAVDAANDLQHDIANSLVRCCSYDTGAFELTLFTADQRRAGNHPPAEAGPLSPGQPRRRQARERGARHAHRAEREAHHRGPFSVHFRRDPLLTKCKRSSTRSSPTASRKPSRRWPTGSAARSRPAESSGSSVRPSRAPFLRPRALVMSRPRSASSRSTTRTSRCVLPPPFRSHRRSLTCASLLTENAQVLDLRTALQRCHHQPMRAPVLQGVHRRAPVEPPAQVPDLRCRLWQGRRLVGAFLPSFT